MKPFVTRFIRVLALLLLGIAGLVALHWAPDRSLESLQPRWAPQPSQFMVFNGMPVHLRDQGPRNDPQPLLLLHGSPASLHTWEGWVRALEPRRRVISLDLPGFGLTGPFLDGDYRIERYSRFLADLLNRLGVARVVLAGNSFGGQLAWQFALDYPQRTHQLILVDAAGYPREASRVPLGLRLARMPLFEPLMARVLPRALIEARVRSVYGDPDQVSSELVERYYELTLRTGNREAFRQRLEQVPAGQHQARIAKVRVPTLILWGGRDGLTPPEHGERFKRDIPGSHLVLFDDLGHVPQEEDPARTVAVVLAFISETLESPR
ncbi:MAG TPA: alpha/beta hydrolase [Pseudomonas sp.]|nr:alpha/beta hydrolase [Pseudomonas sp.]